MRGSCCWTEPGLGTDLVVSVTEGRVVHQVSIDAATEGHVPILDEEFEDIEPFLLDSPEWLDAMGKRGIDPGNVRAVPLSAGVFGHIDEVGRRIVRCSPSINRTRATCRGPIQSTASSPTSTSPSDGWSR